ncbi:MAG: hypothetical protein ABW069_20570 [Duganella sp.]
MPLAPALDRKAASRPNAASFPASDQGEGNGNGNSNSNDNDNDNDNDNGNGSGSGSGSGSGNEDGGGMLRLGCRAAATAMDVVYEPGRATSFDPRQTRSSGAGANSRSPPAPACPAHERGGRRAGMAAWQRMGHAAGPVW